ncbi:hypothetical protein EMIHUDRAFT_258263 [Emiliania huxleyi CCMP1516]|uniref:Uncharacterized protein n=2 Tax=Emiliania huxleyi TaxID=2903 RepID=A0A0D3IB21_EMIH1|nr:hypothetical protein EMIHUDRAFT_258263 [Emiliania huxleyi CCMP1516]EOD08456.1 hypothetical protein EMIHUDRAFT_258263 [Emiliania huxleyi CCMP1516]|eukprot:XP_005760885.1 hypothetical protein EMIHUDRAFT_258263 [Emiliania huxleyi CCMP1516]
MLALQIPRLLKGASLPVIFQSTSADPHTRLEDFTDLLRMQAGGVDERRRIEERRIMLATSLGALYQLVIQPSPSVSTANTLVSRLAAKILTAPQLKLSLADQLAILATAVHDRQHLVQPGASAEDGGPASSGDQPPPPKLLEKALMMPNFQALAASLEGADAQQD